MATNDLYAHLLSQAKEPNTIAGYDRIIENAFNEYMRHHLSDAEYGRIYFACIDGQNRK